MDETPNSGSELARTLSDSPSSSIAPNADKVPGALASVSPSSSFDPRDLIPTPIFLCTIEGRIAWMNAAAEELLGRPSSELAGESFATIFPLADRSRRARALARRHLQGATDFETEVPVQTTREAEHWVGLHIRRVTTTNGRQAYVCSAHDLDATHRELESLRRRTKELAARAEQSAAAAQLKSDVLGTISSEFRAPMNGVISMSRLLLDSNLDRDQLMFAEVIHESGQTLLELVDDVLDFSRIESGQLHIERLDFDLRVMLETIERVLAPVAERRGVKFTTHAHHRVPSRLTGDPSRIRQVLMHLVNQSVERSAPTGVQLRIELSDETPNEVRLRFGVAYQPLVPEDGDAQFEAFVVDDSQTACSHGGAGLGLNIARRLVLLMGGETGLFTESDGTRNAWFRVPLEKQVDRTAEAGSAATSTDAAPVELSTLRALVVDAAGADRDLLVVSVSTFAASCDVAANGDEAIAAIRKAAGDGKPYGAVFCELENADLDHATLARFVRCDAKLSATRLLLLAKLGRPGDAARAEEWGFGAYLVYPYSDEQLADACRAVLQTPLATADAAAEPGTAAGRIVTRHTLAEAKRSRVRVLVVEDNPIDSLVVQSALKRMGYEPQVVSNGQEALAAMGALPFDVILMDLQMPELDGLATTREIRNREAGERHTPILALTAKSSDEDRAACQDAGMDDFLSKPLDLELLAARVEEWIKKTREAEAAADEPESPAEATTTTTESSATTTATPVSAAAPELAATATEATTTEPVATTAEPVATPTPVAETPAPPAIEMELERTFAPTNVERIETETVFGSPATTPTVAQETKIETMHVAMPLTPAVVASAETATAESAPVASTSTPDPVATPAPVATASTEPDGVVESTVASADDFEPTGVVLDPERLEASSMGSPEIRRMLVQAFFTHLEKPLGALRLALQAGDASAVEFQSHSMRGMCASVGAVRCQQLFEQIELRSAANSGGDLWPLVHRATFELARVEAILREDGNDEERPAAAA